MAASLRGAATNRHLQAVGGWLPSYQSGSSPLVALTPQRRRRFADRGNFRAAPVPFARLAAPPDPSLLFQTTTHDHDCALQKRRRIGLSQLDRHCNTGQRRIMGQSCGCIIAFEPGRGIGDGNCVGQRYGGMKQAGGYVSNGVPQARGSTGLNSAGGHLTVTVTPTSPFT